MPNIFSNSPLESQAQDTNALPPEYQDALVTAQRKQQLANYLLQNSMSYQGAQSHGPIASKTPIFAGLANVLSGLAGVYGGNQAQTEQNQVRQNFLNDQTNAIKQFQGISDPNQQIQQGQISQFPLIRGLASGLQGRLDKQRELSANVVKEVSPNTALGIAQGGPIPSALPPTPAVPPKLDWVANPNNPGQSVPMVTNIDPITGKQTGTLSQGGTTVNIPGKEVEMGLNMLNQEIPKRQKDADVAKGTLQANSLALQALQDGAHIGGGEGLKQTIRQVAQAFRLTIPADAPTAVAAAALGQSVMDHIRVFAPVTEGDTARMDKLVGSIGTDPTALTQILAFAQAKSYQTLDNYNKFLDVQGANLKSPEAQAFIQGSKVGYDVPNTLAGPMPFQMLTLQNLQRNGFDISKFKDATGQSVQPEGNGPTQFNIKNPTSGFPGVQENVANSAPPAIPPGTKVLQLQDLSPAQLQMLQAELARRQAAGQK